jgi:hypothetical protein
MFLCFMLFLNRVFQVAYLNNKSRCYHARIKSDYFIKCRYAVQIFKVFLGIINTNAVILLNFIKELIM